MGKEKSKLVNAKGKQQQIAIQRMIRNPKPFVFITGRAGTGKTTIAQDCGYDQVFNQQKYGTLSYTRLQIQMGRHLGFLTGDLDEKTEPFMAPFKSLLQQHLGNAGFLLRGHDKLKFRPIQTMRGDTYPNEFLISDESQNYNIDEMKGLGTRNDVGSTFVIVGNFAQIDDPEMKDPDKNGMYQLLKGFYDRELYSQFDHIHLDEQQRQGVVSIVEDILTPEFSLDPRFEELEKRGLNQAPFETGRNALA